VPTIRAPASPTTAASPARAKNFMKNVGDRVFVDFDKRVHQGGGRQVLQRQGRLAHARIPTSRDAKGIATSCGTQGTTWPRGERAPRRSRRCCRVGVPAAGFDHQLRKESAGGGGVEPKRPGASESQGSDGITDSTPVESAP